MMKRMTSKIKIGDLVTNKFEGPDGKVFGLILRVPYFHHTNVLTTPQEDLLNDAMTARGNDPLEKLGVLVLWSSLDFCAWEWISSLEVVNGTR